MKKTFMQRIAALLAILMFATALPAPALTQGFVEYTIISNFALTPGVYPTDGDVDATDLFTASNNELTGPRHVWLYTDGGVTYLYLAIAQNTGNNVTLLQVDGVTGQFVHDISQNTLITVNGLPYDPNAKGANNHWEIWRVPAASLVLDGSYSITVHTTQGKGHWIIGVAYNAAMSIDKTANKASYAAVGEVITYTVVLRNNGNQVLTGVTLADSLAPAVTLGSPVESGGITAGQFEPGETWTYTYTYTVTAQDLANGSIYNQATGDSDQTTPVADSVTIQGVALVTVSGSKTWLDNDNAYGTRPANLTLVLKANGAALNPQPAPVWDKTGNPWTYQYANLPKYLNGVEIAYTVEETVPAGYAKTADNGRNFTNALTGLISIGGTKAWADNNNQDGLRPASITVRLFRNGALHSSIVLDGVADGSGETAPWTYSFTNLPKFEAGVLVAYTIGESDPSPYVLTPITQPVMSYAANAYTVNLTNTLAPQTTSRTVTKVWNDNDDQDGLRVAVTLKLTATANGNEVPWAALKAASASGGLMDADGLVTLGPGAPLSFDFTSLPVNYLGFPVSYTVDEPVVPAGYTASFNQQTLTVTNSRTPEVTRRTVTKVWDDNNDQDGLRVAVTLKLIATANGNEIPWATLKGASYSGGLMDDDGLVTLGPNAPLSFHFTDLPVHYLGDPVTYTVAEPSVPAGYTASFDQQTLTVTNSRTPETTFRVVSKVWDDNNDQDGLRVPVTLKLRAEASGAEIPWATLKAASATGFLMDDDGLVTLVPGGALLHPFFFLPVNYMGSPVTYTVDEPAVPAGYTASFNQETLTVTNSRTPEVTSRTVTKVWDDNDDQDGLRVAVTLQLKAEANGAEVPWATLKAASASGALMDADGLVTIGPGAPLSHLFENLPANYLGFPVTYTVDEPTVPDGYEKSIDGLTVTNTHIPEVTERTVTKVWDDNNNQDGLRAAVILQLKAEANGAEIPWATLKAASASGALMDPAGIVPLGPGAPLTHLFENLPVNYQGDPVTYTVEELFIPFGYTASYDQQTLTVTNTHIPFVTSVTVEKVWEDNGVTDPAHAAVTLKLTATAGGNPIDWATLVAASASGPLMDQDGEVTLGPDAPLTHEFTDLPAFYQGDPVTYTVDEPVVPGGYEKSVDGLTVTNTRLMMPDIPVRKVWDDQDDLYGLRPASVIIHLIRNEEATPYKQLELNEGNGWQGLFTNLPAKDGDGNNYIYSMREDRVPGYLEPVNTLEGIITFVFTNTLDTVDVPVDKAWDDLDDLHGLRPSGVTVALRQNGAPLTPNQERELNEGNGWSAVFTALPRLDQADMPFLYTVVEEQAQDYLPPQYLPGGEGGITVLNTLDLIRIGGTKTWDDGDDIDRIRPASITVRLMDGDTEVDARTVTAAEGWTYLFESLPRTRNGILIHYAVTEDGVPGYVLEPVTQPDFEAGAEDGTTEFTVDLVNTNPLPRNVTMIPVTKVWEHGTNTDLPEAITIRVMDGDTEVAVRTLREPWTLNVTGLPRLRDNGEPIIYTITEDPVPNYRTAIDQDARVITNTYVEPVTPRDVVLGLDTIYNTGDSFH